MVLKTEKDIEQLVAEMNDCTAEQDMTFWQGNDGCLHATEEPRGSVADCLYRINCAGSIDSDFLITLLSERGLYPLMQPRQEGVA